MDITQLILDDHHEQRRRFALLEQMGSASGAALSDVWARLAVFLEVHAAAEEEIFYPELVKLALAPRPVARAEPETLDAIYDHNEIRDAIAAVRPHRVGSVRLARRSRGRQPGQRRSHGGGRTRGPDRLPAQRQLARAP